MFPIDLTAAKEEPGIEGRKRQMVACGGENKEEEEVGRGMGREVKGGLISKAETEAGVLQGAE